MKTMLLALFTALSLASCNLPKIVTQEIQVKKFPIRTTAYTSNEKDHLKYGCKNAVGTTLKTGQIATDWSRVPVGTKLKIDGQLYTVTDYGSAMVHRPLDESPTIDVYKNTRSQMNKWGVRHFADVEVVKWGSWEQSAKLLKDRLRYKHCRLMYERIQEKL